MTKDSTTSGVAEHTKLLESLFHRLLYRDTVGLPRQCVVGDDMKRHLEKMEKYFKSCGMVDEETKTTVLLNSIEEDMQMELCGLLEFHAHQHDYGWVAAKLVELYHPKQSEISAYIKLFSHKQKRDQSTREFLSEIRREGYRLLKELKPEDREEKMIAAFCGGLYMYNEDVRKALSHREIKTLEEAYNLIKQEKNTDEEYVLRRMLPNDASQPTEIEKLWNQVAMMQKQLNHLISIVQSDKANANTKRSYAQVVMTSGNGVERDDANVPIRKPEREKNNARNNYRQVRPNPRMDSRCYNCKDRRHLARNCPHPCFVCGRRNESSKTLISENHPETAADKPIISGTRQGLKSKILCDSGAGVNVIDEGLLHEIQSVDKTVQLRKSKRMIKCANNSKMPVAGTTVLELKFPSITKYCKFLVVKNLFPKVIIGMRAMKSLKMTIDPPHDRVVVNGLGISFLSKTKIESIDQGNVRKSVL